MSTFEKSTIGKSRIFGGDPAAAVP